MLTNLKNTLLSLVVMLSFAIPQAQAAASTNLSAASLIVSNNTLALGLIRQRSHSGPNANHFYSPYGLINLLAMAQNGLTQPKQSLLYHYMHWHSASAVNRSIYQQNQALAQLNRKDAIELANNSAVWLDNRQSILPSFQAKIKTYGPDLLHLAPFIKNPSHGADLINQWVSQTTRQSINNMFTADMVKNSNLILINTNYFKGKWQYPFQASTTTIKPFYGTGKPTQRRFMRRTLSTSFYHNKKWQMINLPYQGGDISLTVLLPTKSNTLKSALVDLDLTSLTAMQKKMKNTTLSLNLPAFSFRNSASLLADLAQMKVLNQRMIYNQIIKKDPLQISAIIQQTKIDVDEAGTTAASATAAIFTTTAVLAPPPISMNINHPFLFFISNKQGLILYIGIVNQLPSIATDTNKKPGSAS